MRRQRITYLVEHNQTVEAYLLRPVADAGPRPAIVVFHSTVNHSLRQPAGVEGVPEKAFGLQLAKRGFVTLCPRNFLWPVNDRIEAAGEAEKFLARHPESKGMDRMLLDGLVAVNLLSSLDDVDATRIGCVGHSLGAKEALYLAAFDDRVRATVSSEGGIGISFSNWDASWYLGPAVKAEGFAMDHHELLALVAPRPFLLIGGDSADGAQSWPYIAAALPVYHLYGEPARLGLWNHQQGHTVPPAAVERIAEWFETYLGARNATAPEE
ncbi:MAG: dienelactone hydrolase family protein [Planctomycetaceae bacterium]